MSPSGRLCLLTIIGLVLPTRGQILEGATLSSPADPITANIHALTRASGEERPTDTVHPELQSTPQSSPLQTGETTQSPVAKETQSQHPVGTDMHLATHPQTDWSSTAAALSADPTKGTTLSKRQTSRRDVRTDPVLKPTGASEDNPFSYDEDALRKRGLLVAAVLFITGIFILTSGKCSRLPRLCWNYDSRTYRIVNKAQPEREDMDGADGPSPLCSQPCPP
ncbi:FXYD domain-containing ion transport regulator 5 isoform X1 [Manis pentadactyla]|uniref:FXYD domain-containing ion transport regulator 5 isoform X1 n=1 Tax=Manis pentadactyla TaxID=143292 RepID=UPI00255C71D4|nr:FXYD domain-containing ion transport regulator 5 isoform X1 [Manis pentadactyla]XP_057348892.1 FXYD domain-containing ion transport regulator 5 isoform X1 [Manis pentadactyla]XP_057348893.1 FXYD domain-containing ion transport regulator 5 isoform X1 [Manis pentadactyla]XP_057348894.1 FXYD domain-containing ion transport regulator 5 isoform X1 [Manis pentadactyla]